MLWSILIIAGIIAFFCFPAFRKTVFIIAGVLSLVIFAYIENQKRQTEESKSLVHADNLEFTDMRLGPETYGSSYKLTGRVKNNSQYTVFEIKAKLHVLDCDEKSHCDVVGEEEEWNIAPLLPQGQVRDIDTSIYFNSEMHVRGQFQWDYGITEIRART
jgi:hypothetical protein